MDGIGPRRAGANSCNVCGGDSFTLMAQRSDAVNVMECTNCGMGVIEEIPADLGSLYNDSYYGGGISEDDVGYGDYAFTAEHGVSWAAALVQLLKPGGSILDIGCADGALLRKLPKTFKCYGIEVNEHMAERAADQGAWIVGSDLLDPRVLREYRSHFDVVTSIAVFEHLADLRRGLEVSIDLLKDDGFLLFEVPYISAQHENKVWFESSLEHVFYPSKNSLRHLIETELGAYLAGGELYVRDYASTYVGLVSKSFDFAMRAQRLFERLTHLDRTPRAPAERHVRQMLLLVHAAESNQDLISGVSDLPADILTRPLRQRLEQLWSDDLRRMAALRLERAALTEARDYHAARAERHEALYKESAEQHASLVESYAKLSASHTETQERLARVEDEFHLASDELHRANDAAQQVLVERDAARHLLAQARSDIAALLSDQKTSFANLARGIEIAGIRISEAREETSAVRRELAAVQAEHRDLIGQLERILDSTAWKLSYPGRWLGQRHPAIGRLGRRALKLAWWTMRLQLISRLREVRQLHALAAPAIPDPATTNAAPVILSLPPVVLAKKNGIPSPLEWDDEVDPWPADRPLVSVVIPCFNYGRFVAEAVDSVLAQTFTDLEIIVVEGGSTSDESRKLTLNLDRPRTRIIAQDSPHFAGANRNFGISQARGKYICCLDADDKLHPTYIEKAVFLLENYDYDTVSTATQFFGNRDDRIGIYEKPTLEDMVHANHMLTCAIFRRSLWRRAGGYRDTDPKITGYVFEDWGFWVRLAALGARFFNISGEALFLYRSHGPSISTQSGLHSNEVHRALIREINADLLDLEPSHADRITPAPPRAVIDPWRDLASRAVTVGDDRPVLLIALPFLIVGGAERLLSGIVAGLTKSGWRVLITTSVHVGAEHGDTTGWFEAATSEIYHLPRYIAPERWREFVRYLIQSRHVDVLWIVGSAFIYDMLPSLKVEFDRLKVVDLLFNPIGHLANNRKHADLIDVTFVENREVLQALHGAGESDDRIALIPSGVDLQSHRPGPRAPEVVERLEVGEGELIVGFSGRWSEEKDPLAFVEIARRTPKDLPIRFVMTGTGGMRAAIETAVNEAGFAPGRFNLVGEVPDVAPYLQSYDVLVLPSRLDGRPVVVMEALAFGVPVVASRVGALPEMVQDGVTGFLCEPGAIDSFVDRLTKLARDRDLQARMKRAARTYAEDNLDAREMTRRYEKRLRQLMGSYPTEVPA